MIYTFFRSTVSFIAVWLCISSCASVKTEVADIPQEDSQAIMYYRDGAEPGDNGMYVSRTLQDSIPVPVVSQTNSMFVDLSTSSNLHPSISSDGLYISFHDELGDKSKYAPYGHEQSFSIFDIKKNAVILNATTIVSSGTSLTTPYSVPWSFFGHNFYTLAGDTIKKCTVEGKQSSLAVIDHLINFSVSPSERWLLFMQEERVGFINLETNEVVLAKEFETIFGIVVKHWGRVISWSPDESKAAFAVGFRMTIVDLEKRENQGYKVSADVFAIEWITNDSFVYVQGFQPNADSHLNDDPFFEIDSYSLTTKQTTMLHRRVHHEPSSVKPKVSPSGKLLLFSEKKVAGVYEVKLLPVSGGSITTLCSGYNPVWGK